MMQSKIERNDAVPDVILIGGDRKIPSRSITNGRRERRLSRRRSSTRKQNSTEQADEGEKGGHVEGMQKTASMNRNEYMIEGKKQVSSRSKFSSRSKSSSEYKESSQLLSDDNVGDDDDDDDTGSIDLMTPKRRSRRRIQRRSSLDPTMLQRGSGDAPPPRRKDSRRQPRRRGSVQHRSEPAVTFSYSDDYLSSSISDLDTDELSGSFSNQAELPFGTEDDTTGHGAMLARPHGGTRTTTSSGEELMPLGDLCASLMPPKILHK
eukprot:CAMPEP_0119006276 /NCGR_PEP_ID=MMETSP1176-20130426/2207_1 /TAXON_ID=265551 /ORGANISM="Synedropsis recta cf, Strain CCMP1620" /LENGTH=263 /DNA_ID=CAMNT_0006958175 /DNA_START=46 /DNA_END=837 /DNA_ORIENTATION=+